MERATPPVTEPAHEPIAADTLTIVTTVPRAATLPVDALPHASHMPARAVAVFHVKRFHTAAATTHAEGPLCTTQPSLQREATLKEAAQG